MRDGNLHVLCRSIRFALGPSRERRGRRHYDGHSRASRPAAVESFPRAGDGRARGHLDSGRACSHHHRGHRPRAPEHANAGAVCRGDRRGRLGVYSRRGCWRAAVRLAHRPFRPAARFLRHLDRLSPRRPLDRDLLELLELRTLSRGHRVGHRRRIRGYQLGDRRTHSGAIPRARRSHHQWKFLAGSGGWSRSLAAVSRSELDRAQSRMAARLRHRRNPRTRHPTAAPLRAGKPALAHHPWLDPQSRCDHRRHRAARARGHRRRARPAA